MADPATNGSTGGTAATFGPSENLRITLTDVSSKGTDAFTLIDYKWSAGQEYAKQLAENPDYMPPKLLITEYQPALAIDTGKFIDSGLDILGTTAKGKKLANIFKKAMEYAPSVTKALTDSYLVAPKANDPYIESYVKKMFTARKIRQYEIPFFNSAFMEANTTDKWSYTGTSLSQGSKIAEMKQKLMNADFPNTPVWTMNVAELGQGLDCQFRLINDSEENFLKNFK